MAVLGRTLVLLLGALTAFAPLTIDMYLPALPTMAEHFHSPIAAVQLTLSIFFIGLAIGQVLYGPLSDTYGRKAPLQVGLVIYVLASVGCAFAPTIDVMIGLRFVQAIGGAAGAVIARAVVRDYTSGQESARLFSSLMLVMGVAPILAPLAGGYVLIFLSWQAIFLMLAAFGAICLLATVFLLPETLPVSQRRPTGVVAAVSSFGALLRDRRFMGYALAGGVAFSTMFVYITISPNLFIGVYGFSPTGYAWLFGSNAAGLIGASQLNRYLLRKWSLFKVLRLGLTLHLIAALTFLAAAAAGAPLAVFIVPLFLTIAVLGLVGPNGSAASLSVCNPRLAGSASSLMGTVPFVFGAGAGAIVGLLPEGTPTSLAVVMVGCALTAWLSQRFLAGKAEA